MANRNHCALGHGAVFGFPRCNIVERNLRWRRDVQIHYDERSDQPFRRNFSRSPGSGNERPGGDDFGSRWGRYLRTLSDGLPDGQIDNARISIPPRGMGPPIREEQNGENEGVGDNETANSHEWLGAYLP